MGSFKELREGLRDVLQDNIPEVRVYDAIPTQPLEYPCIYISHFEAFNYLPQLQAAAFTLPFMVYVRVRSANDADAITQMEEYAWPTGDKSILATMNSNHTLGGTIQHAWLSGVGTPARDPDNQDRAWEWELPFTIQITHAVS